jgi:hypothetical protein
MADFALWVTAAEPALPWGSGRFLAAYSDNREQAHESILADSAIHSPLVAVLEKRGGTWTGTASELLDALAVEAGDKTAKQKAWPAKPNTLMNGLKRLAPALRAAGITIERARQPQTGKRIVTIVRAVKHRHPSSPSSLPQDFRSRGDDDHVGKIVTGIVTSAGLGPAGDNPGDDQKTAEMPQGGDGDNLLHTPHVLDLEQEEI